MINIDGEAEIPPVNDESDSDEHVSWQAYEYMPDQRPVSWYIGLGVLSLLFMAIAIFLIRSWSFTIVVAAAAAALFVYAKRQPRTINYTLSPKGLYVDDELKSLDAYKAFGVRQDGDQYILTILPIKRFSPSLVAYFPEAVGEEIVDFMASRMPMQEIEPDVVDKIVKKLRL